MKNLQLIIEFSDCILQGKDLLNYQIVVDDDEKRIYEMRKQAEEKLKGLPNKGRVDGVQCSPAKKVQIDGIIKENIKIPVGRPMTA